MDVGVGKMQKVLVAKWTKRRSFGGWGRLLS